MMKCLVPLRLVTKLRDLWLSSSLCSWVLNFLTLNIGAPQGCVLSLPLYSLYTYDCTAIHSTNTIVKFVDATAVNGLNSDNMEMAYLEEVELLASWCKTNIRDLT